MKLNYGSDGMDREKVIKGLEKWIDDPLAQNAEIEPQLVHDALELLKEQEPRVMTLDEVKAFDWDYCYLEEERLPGKTYRAICGDYALTCITWSCIASMRIQHGDDHYGKKWRCWTAKPTEDQRQAVKWE